MNNKILVEVCAGSLESCINANNAGADRIELVTQAHHGGLTPSLGLVKAAIAVTKIPIIAMVRPRIGGFNYSDVEKELMFEEANILLESGVSGIVFGFLNKDLTIDLKSTKKMVDLIHSYGKESVFHRAIDVVNDQFIAFEQLIQLGVTRVLTSGGMKNVDLGFARLKQLNEKFGNQIEIIAGGGVNINNAMKLVNEAKIVQLHSTFKSWGYDVTTSTEKMSFKYNDLGDYDYSDEVKIREFINIMKDGIE